MCKKIIIGMVMGILCYGMPTLAVSHNKAAMMHKGRHSDIRVRKGMERGLDQIREKRRALAAKEKQLADKIQNMELSNKSYKKIDAQRRKLDDLERQHSALVAEEDALEGKLNPQSTKRNKMVKSKTVSHKKPKSMMQRPQAAGPRPRMNLERQPEQAVLASSIAQSHTKNKSNHKKSLMIEFKIGMLGKGNAVVKRQLTPSERAHAQEKLQSLIATLRTKEAEAKHLEKAMMKKVEEEIIAAREQNGQFMVDDNNPHMKKMHKGMAEGIDARAKREAAEELFNEVSQ